MKHIFRRDTKREITNHDKYGIVREPRATSFLFFLGFFFKFKLINLNYRPVINFWGHSGTSIPAIVVLYVLTCNVNNKKKQILYFLWKIIYKKGILITNNMKWYLTMEFIKILVADPNSLNICINKFHCGGHWLEWNDTYPVVLYSIVSIFI